MVDRPRYAAPMTLQIDSRVSLSSGTAMPVFGLGVFKAGAETQNAVTTALAAGYRHIDTAAIYRNETDVGAALAATDVPREEIFVTTKLWNDDQGYDSTLRAFDMSLSKLGLEYVDLYLQHWPVPGQRLESWRAMEKLHAEGRARAIGISNFMVKHMEELLGSCNTPPAVNQFELHPYVYGSRRGVVDFCREKNIAVTAYSPLTKGRKLDDPALGQIAAGVGRTPAQVLIRWALDRDLIVIPKSSNPGRIRENAGVFEFSLTPDQLAALDALDENLVTAWDPTGAP